MKFSPVFSYFSSLGINIFLNILSSNTLSLRSSLSINSIESTFHNQVQQRETLKKS